MTSENLDDDNYIVNLLKEDAKKSAKKYKTVGLDAFLPERAKSGAPKPNTRFLRHLIRETDNHNAALLAREAEDSWARLKKMDQSKDSTKRDPRRLTPPGLSKEETPPKKRKRPAYNDEDRERKRRPRRERDYSGSEDYERSRDKRKDGDRKRSKRREHGKYTDSEEEYERYKSKYSTRRRHKKRRHDYSSEEDRSTSRRQYSDRRDMRRRFDSRHALRSRSPQHRSRDHHKSSRHRYRPRSRSRSENIEAHPHVPEATNKSRHSRRKSPASISDSDPLEAIVGPLPPPPQSTVRSRGRGVHKANSMAMDARFSSSYDPTSDVHLNSDVDDEWGDALEALKDRQHWKQQGAERLKAAGFTDEQVKKWENGDKKTEEDVTWARKGEGREWDRGKVVDEDGDIALKANWGRLT